MSDFKISALLTIAPMAFTWATKVNFTLSFGAIFWILLLVNVVSNEVKLLLLTNNNPAGNTSFTCTFLAVSGPVFFTVMV